MNGLAELLGKKSGRNSPLLRALLIYVLENMDSESEDDDNNHSDEFGAASTLLSPKREPEIRVKTNWMPSP